MKERLVQLLDLEQITPSKFADIIGVQRSSVSHVISGRNKPSFDFIQKTLRAFPGLNADWLILGTGTMYEQMGRAIGGTLFDATVEPSEPDFQDQIPYPGQVEEHTSDSAGTSISGSEDQLQPTGEGDIPTQSSNIKSDTSKDESGSDRQPTNINLENADREVRSQPRGRIVQVMVFYDDDTFHSFKPSS
jgi:transcriptional regulator with XRE-family HTH domain